MLLRVFHEPAQGLHGGDKFLSEFRVLLVLPGAAEGVEPGLQSAGAGLDIFVEAFEFRRKAPDLIGVHDGLGHN